MPPPRSNFKLNFDGSIKGHSIATCFIITCAKGSLVQSTTFNIGFSPVYMVEVVGLLKSLKQV